MWQATLRDLQWRRRRFLIAVTGTALVFAMSLLMSGLAASFTLETDRALESIGADVWVVQEGASGPFTSFSPIPATDAERVAAVDGITAADPIIYFHQTIGDDPEDINLFGVVRGGIGEPELTDGRALEGPGEAIVDHELGLDVGETFTMSGAGVGGRGQDEEHDDQRRHPDGLHRSRRRPGTTGPDPDGPDRERDRRDRRRPPGRSTAWSS